MTRSFLMLEDDYDVDWEVDPNEHSLAPHPHRVPLRGRSRRRRRRPGAPLEQPAHHCLSPVGRAVAFSRIASAGGRGGSARTRGGEPRVRAGRSERHCD